jgi:GWxTD domain-containing protein
VNPASKKILVWLFLFAAGCQTQKQFTQKPSKSLINPDSDLVEVNAAAFHLNDSISTLFVEVVNENLVYKRPDTTSAFYAEIRVSYKLFADAYNKRVLDSSSVYLRDRAVEKVDIKSLKTEFAVKARAGAYYYLEIQVYDLHKKVVYTKGINVYKKNRYSEQNYLVTLNGNVSFNHRFTGDDVIKVHIQNPAVTEVKVDCFIKDFAPPPPPFSNKSADEMKYVADSTFVLPVKSGSFEIAMPAAGFYHIRSDVGSFEGLTVFSFSKTFPGVGNSDEMINCTRYIMNKEEFEKCKGAASQKEAIDKFWQTIGGSNERAREILKRYYGRVKEANKYYSSYTEGWRTDRGMLFVIFGQPTYIYRNNRGETWVYGFESNPGAVRYQFVKTRSPFSDNDFMLERSQFYKDHWYSAVDVWRQGHVYINHDK